MQDFQWVIWIALMSLVMGWLGRSRMHRAGEAGVLRHPWSVLVIGVVVGGLFALLAVLCVKFPGKNGGPKIAAVFVGFAGMGAMVVADYLRSRFVLEPDGLRYRTLTQSGTVPWAEVSSVVYSESAKWFVIESSAGTKVRVSCMLMGLPELARAVLSNVPAERIEEGTRPILAATASGYPPSVWQ